MLTWYFCMFIQKLIRFKRVEAPLSFINALKLE